MANALTPFLHPTGGFGKAAYDRAIAGGLTPVEIQALLPGSGVLAIGPQARALLDQINAEPAQEVNLSSGPKTTPSVSNENGQVSF